MADLSNALIVDHKPLGFNFRTETMKSITLNGESQQTDSRSLADLIEQLQLQGKRFAVEVNQQLVPKSQLATTLIQADDCIEIIHAVGGG